jgi:hypothetical protein
MHKTLDDFSKSLAGSMSRRSAFLKLLAGAGAFGFLGLRKTKAGTSKPPKLVFPKNPALCESYCLTYADEVYLECAFNNPKQASQCFSEQNVAYLDCMYECECSTSKTCVLG